MARTRNPGGALEERKMHHKNRWVIMLLLAVCLPLAACKQGMDAAASEEEGPAKVEHLTEDGPARVTLTEDAANRLGVETSAVRDTVIAGQKRWVIPYAAILYDTHGDTWAFVNVSPLAYMREHIDVAFIQGDVAVLAKPLTSGSQVVTTAAAELYGSEIEFEEE
jgi:hypothetical protein